MRCSKLRCLNNTRPPNGPTHEVEILRLLTGQAESTTKLPCPRHHPASAHSLLHLGKTGPKTAYFMHSA